MDSIQHSIVLGQAINLVHNEFTQNRQVKVIDENREQFKERVGFMFKLLCEIREEHPWTPIKKVEQEKMII